MMVLSAGTTDRENLMGAVIEILQQEIKNVDINGVSTPRDCYGIADNASFGTDEFAYHIVNVQVTRTGAYAPAGNSRGHLFAYFSARARTRCGKSITDGTAGEINLFHTTKLCMGCARTVPGLRLTRQFKITEGSDQFSIREVAPTNLVSLDYRDQTVSREGAWQAASVQLAPVVFFGLDDTVRHLGVVFNPERYERAAYQGYVAAGYVMTDGYYAPLQFETWLANFRKSPVLDEPEQQHLRPALALYTASLPVRVD
jgi:hypothetical protein